MTPRERYDGPIEPGMVFTAPGNDGKVLRRDKVIGRMPDDASLLIMEALPCPMRKRLGSGVGELFKCPELNLRVVMRPEVDDET